MPHALGTQPRLTNHIILPRLTDSWTPHPPAPINANSGIVFVAMDPRSERRSSILIPSEVAGHTRYDTGTVVAVGAHDLYKRGKIDCKGIKDLAVGDRVIVLPMAGVWFRRLRIGDWIARDVRYYGIISENETYPIREDMGIIAAIEGTTMRMREDWMLVHRDDCVREQSGLLLTENARLRNWKATVCFCGPVAKEQGAFPGMRVIYHAPSTSVEVSFEPSDYGLPGDREDYAVIRFKETVCEMNAGAEVALALDAPQEVQK